MSILKRAAEFHGHLGPYLVLGLKMGVLAKNTLNADPFEIRAEIHTEKITPNIRMYTWKGKYRCYGE